MDYKVVFQEKLSKLLFLEIDGDGFKKTINMPEYIRFENKDLYIPILAERITSDINDEIKIKNIPIHYFIEGMMIAIGADENLRFAYDYETIFSYLKDGEVCAKSLIANKVKEENYSDAYLLTKGLYKFTNDKEVFSKLLLVGENIRENDRGIESIFLKDIEDGEKKFPNLLDIYLYKAMIMKDREEFEKAKVLIHEYINKGGKVTEEVNILLNNIENVADYEKALELLNDKPVEAIKLLVKLVANFDNNPLIYYYLGVAYRKLENYEKAIYYLNEGIAIESGILEMVVELGVNYACIGEYERAINYFKKAFEASREVEICTNIVMSYIHLQNFEEAKLHLEIAKKLNPEDEIVIQLEKVLNAKLK